MKVYLDTSVINIYLFGKYSELETERVPSVDRLFKLINEEKINALLSLYSIQEIYIFCKKIFSADDAGHISRISLSVLFRNKFELSGLLTREERLLHRAKFNMDDLPDQPHAISAFINKCSAIITYDRHFQKIAAIIPVYTPEQIVNSC
ncbi:MAG: type II toxin-antitoxin system VapC family toxin [Nitrospirae bacterium]|nr:type II toxin-antitoxin system VapC family toxin [Nitrospirota bacterium]